MKSMTNKQPPRPANATPSAGLWTEVNPAVRHSPATATAEAPANRQPDPLDVDTNRYPGIELATLDSLEDELKFLRQDCDELIVEANDAADEAADSTPLMGVNQADPHVLLNNENFSFDARCKLIYFLKKMKRSPWMKWADNRLHVQRIALGLCAPWQSGGSMALCGLHNRFCQLFDYCPRCCLRVRSKPTVREYRKAFDRAPHWMMMTPSFESDPEHAGLHYVARKGDRKRKVSAKLRHHRPFAGRGLQHKAHLTPDLDVGDENPITDCFQTIFDLGHELIRSGVAQGVLAQREIAWNFEADPVRCWVTPNGSLIINSAEPVTYEIACGVYDLFQALYQAKPFGGRLYPDLHCESIQSQKELNRCLFYALKPMQYAEGYLRAVNAGADIQALNTQIGDRVFQGGSEVLSTHRSPRRLGNMRCNADGYIGAGSVTADRKEQTRLKRQGRHRHDQDKPTRGLSEIEKAIGRATLQQREGD